MITIEVRKRRDDFHAQVKRMPTHWGCGTNETEAIGDLIKTHSHSFGFSSQVIKNLTEMSKTLASLYILIDKDFHRIEIERIM